ncbi:MAG: MATE family efflux transporter [Veillonellaceae bacterium]|nr:MATE family efflux transporter [Veillonellaceae bacterium]
MTLTLGHKIDMLHGSLWDKLILFAFPLAMTAFLEQLFNAGDIAVLGRYMGKDAVAAIGNNLALIGVFVSLFLGLALGANVVIARCIGAEQDRQANEGVHTAWLLSLVAGFLIMIVGQLITNPIMQLLAVPPEVESMAEVYLRVYLLGIPAISLYNFEAAIFRSRGDTATPLVSLLVASLLNIILNIWFVQWFANGVAGVAAAMAASAISIAIELAVYCIILSFSQAATTFVSQNYGAGQGKRCSQILWWCLGLNILFTAIACTIIMYYAYAIIGFFDNDSDVLRLGVERMWYVVAPEGIQIFIDIFSGAMRGYGFSLAPAVLTMVGVCGVRLTWVYTIFDSMHTFAGLMVVYPISWIVTGFFIVILYAYFKGHVIKHWRNFVAESRPLS